MPKEQKQIQGQDKHIKKDKKKAKKDKKKSDDKLKDKKKKPQWGKFGVIRYKSSDNSTSDMYQKREEFLMWLSEVKKLNVEAIAPQEEKKYFEEFVECYNTATFPSKKYYNFRFWFEKEQFRERIAKSEFEMSTFDDENEKRKEQQEQKELIKKQKLQREYQHLHEFKNIAQDMQKQKQLQELMRHHNQMGNHEAAMKIQKQLAPIVTLDQPKLAAQPAPEYDYDYGDF